MAGGEKFSLLWAYCRQFGSNLARALVEVNFRVARHPGSNCDHFLPDQFALSYKKVNGVAQRDQDQCEKKRP
jgi:hypothetical protein